MGRGETSQAIGVLARPPGQTEEISHNGNEEAPAEFNLSDVMAELGHLRADLRRLKVACGLSIGLALVLIGTSFLIESESQVLIYSGLFVLAGIFAALYPYFHFRAGGTSATRALKDGSHGP